MCVCVRTAQLFSTKSSMACQPLKVHCHSHCSYCTWPLNPSESRTTSLSRRSSDQTKRAWDETHLIIPLGQMLRMLSEPVSVRPGPLLLQSAWWWGRSCQGPCLCRLMPHHQQAAAAAAAAVAAGCAGCAGQGISNTAIKDGACDMWAGGGLSTHRLQGRQ